MMMVMIIIIIIIIIIAIIIIIIIIMNYLQSISLKMIKTYTTRNKWIS